MPNSFGFLADLSLLKYSEKHPLFLVHRDAQQEKLWKFLSSHFPTFIREKKWLHAFHRVKHMTYAYNFYHIVHALQDRKSVDEDQMLKDARNLLREYNIEVSADRCLQTWTDSMTTAVSHINWVYDVKTTDPKADDFNGALLKCVLHSVECGGDFEASQHVSSPEKAQRFVKEDTQTIFERQKYMKEGKEEKNDTMDEEGEKMKKIQAERFWKRLKYTMLWGRDDLLESAVLREVESLGRAKKNSDLASEMHKALVYALQHNKVYAIKALKDRPLVRLTLVKI